MKIAAISDIHGNIHGFKNILEKIGFPDKIDRLVLLGDYVDRGNRPIETIKFIMELKNNYDNKVIVLKGNHEEMLLNAINNKHNYIDVALFFRNGGQITFEQFEKLNIKEQIEILNFIKKLPLYYEEGNHIFVHAGINSNYPLNQQHEQDLIWSREEFYQYPGYKNKIVVFGHTPVFYIEDRTTIWFDPIYKDKIGIDCRAGANRHLACLLINDFKSYDTEYINLYEISL